MQQDVSYFIVILLHNNLFNIFISWISIDILHYDIIITQILDLLVRLAILENDDYLTSHLRLYVSVQVIRKVSYIIMISYVIFLQSILCYNEYNIWNPITTSIYCIITNIYEIITSIEQIINQYKLILNQFRIN